MTGLVNICACVHCVSLSEISGGKKIKNTKVTIPNTEISKSNHLIDFPISLARIARDASPSHAMDGAERRATGAEKSIKTSRGAQ